jgi:hypothetical protein
MRYQTAPRPGELSLRNGAQTVTLASARVGRSPRRQRLRAGDGNRTRTERRDATQAAQPCDGPVPAGQSRRARYIAQAAESKRRLRLQRTTWLLNYFEAHPCRDCGESDPVVLDFDHHGNKAFEIGEALTYRRWETILAEIAKCDVVCANCHRRRTARRRGSVRAVMAALRVEAE